VPFIIKDINKGDLIKKKFQVYLETSQKDEISYKGKASYEKLGSSIGENMKCIFIYVLNTLVGEIFKEKNKKQGI